MHLSDQSPLILGLELSNEYGPARTLEGKKVSDLTTYDFVVNRPPKEYDIGCAHRIVG